MAIDVRIPDDLSELEGVVTEDDANELRDDLLERLAVQREYMLPMFAWYSNRQDSPAVQERYKQAYRLLLDMSTRAWARLIVDTISERLEIQGIVADDDKLEADAWNLLQANHVDADQRLVHREALIAGRSYIGIADTDVGPRLTPESALQVTHSSVPGNPRLLTSGLKVFATDDDGEDWRAELYTPTGVYTWEVETDDDEAGRAAYDVETWKRAELVDQRANALGYVPFVPFENRPLILTPGRSELHELLPIFRSIDAMILNLLLAADAAAFRQKWATGLNVPKDPDTGKPVEPYKAALDRLWVSKDAETKFGTFEATDVDQYIKVIDSFVAELAAISRVPAYYLLSQTLANPPSAESLVAGESGLVFKVKDRQAQFGESWERVVRCALELAGVSVESLQMLWRDPAQRSPGQVSDAAVKMQAIGVPQEELWLYVGFTPEQVDRMRAQAAEQAFVEAASQPIPPPSAPPPIPPPPQPSPPSGAVA